MRVLLALIASHALAINPPGGPPTFLRGAVLCPNTALTTTNTTARAIAESRRAVCDVEALSYIHIQKTVRFHAVVLNYYYSVLPPGSAVFLSSSL